MCDNESTKWIVESKMFRGVGEQEWKDNEGNGGNNYAAICVWM